MIREAIERELERGGQVFFVHNRVQSLPSMARFLQELVPDARIVIGHGQMNERELEATMVRFVSGQADVLRLDHHRRVRPRHPDLEHDHHQPRRPLRPRPALPAPRAGRARAPASLRLPARPRATGASTSRPQRRLRVLQELTELGAGFKLALRDLEIRGAGNLLGAEQHGHIAAVGFDLYSKLLAEAVRELKGEPTAATVEPVVSVNAESFLPDDYVPEVNQRLALYKRLAGARSDEAVAELRAELTDRFGPLPTAAEQLLDTIRIRVAARDLGIERVEVGEGRALLTFAASTSLDPQRLVAAIQKSRGRLKLKREFTVEAVIDRGPFPVVRDAVLGLLAELPR